MSDVLVIYDKTTGMVVAQLRDAPIESLAKHLKNGFPELDPETVEGKVVSVDETDLKRLKRVEPSTGEVEVDTAAKTLEEKLAALDARIAAQETEASTLDTRLRSLENTGRIA